MIKNDEILIYKKDSGGSFTLKHLKWDTEFFNKKIGVLNFDKGYMNEDEIEQGLKQAETYAIKESYDCWYVRIPTADVNTLNIFENNGYRHMDTLVTFTYDLKKENKEINKNIYNYNVKLAGENDKDALSTIAKSEHNGSRFFNDPRLKDKANMLYAEWIKKDLENENTDVFVIEKSGEIAGYISCNYDNKIKRGRINLIAVKREYQRMGLGKALLSYAINNFFKKGMMSVYVGTHLANLSSMNLYIKTGFKLVNAEYSLHKWFSKEKGD